VLPQRRADGCWGLDLPTTPVERLGRLGDRCAPGFTALLPAPRQVQPEGTATVDVPLPTLPPGACLRAAAVGQGAAVELTLLGEAPLGTDADPAFALLSPEGPVCPPKRDGLRLRVRRSTGEGPLWVQAWSSVNF
jgi:hypothetical protein